MIMETPLAQRSERDARHATPNLAYKLHVLFLHNKLNLLMLGMPLAIYLQHSGGEPSHVFGLSLLAIAPFAERLSFVTEQLAMHTSDVFGGLLNATFGNVTELIVSLFALRYGMLRIVQVSLIGSILSNLLLVLGCAFFAGGAVVNQQRFSASVASVSSSIMLLCVAGLLFPMLIDVSAEEVAPGATLAISRAISCVMIIVYAGFIYFQLATHSYLYEPAVEASMADSSERGLKDLEKRDIAAKATSLAAQDDADEEESILGVGESVFWLAVITVAISVLSEYMVDSLEAAAEGWGVPDLFLGTIIIPVVGNAAEHAAAIIFAAKNKMELALSIAVGSSIQIGMFCVPALVLTAWWLDSPLSLNFGGFETAALLVTVLIVNAIIQRGESNYMQGLVLIAGYAFISVAFFVHVDPEPTKGHLVQEVAL